MNATTRFSRCEEREPASRTKTKRSWLLGAVTALVLGLALPPVASADPVVISSMTSVVKAGKPAQLSLDLTHEVRSCALQFERGHATPDTDFTDVTHSRLRWSWTTPAKARAGKWRVFVVCALEDGETRELKRSLRVHGPKRGRAVVFGRVKVKQSGTRLREVPAGPGPTAETADNNTFPKGQCTYWGYEKRPDIYENSWAGDGFGWSARHWDDNARLTGGYVVDGQPRAGDIAVWEAGYRGAGQSGHVAYVEAVHEDGSIGISEMNYAGNHDVSTRVLDAETVRGLSFIHQR